MKIIAYILGAGVLIGVLFPFLRPVATGIGAIFSDFSSGFLAYIPPEAMVGVVLLVGFVLYSFISSFFPW